MEFGRLTNIDDVDFTLLADPPENLRVLATAALARHSSGRVLVGLSGWSDRGLIGPLYPRGAGPGEFLAHYAKVFPTNELNSTYYGVSTQRIERWSAVVPGEFRFCPKLPKTITHDRALQGVDDEMERFVQALESFAGKVGRVWGVLAPSFSPARMSVLEGFLESWSDRIPLAVELRHLDWFADAKHRESVFSCFEAHGVAAILTDVAGRRDVLHMRITAPDTMIRMVGNAPHPTDLARVDDWAARLADWWERGLRSAYVFFHQKSDPDAIHLARRFGERFRERTGVDLLPALPPVEDDATLRQGELF